MKNLGAWRDAIGRNRSTNLFVLFDAGACPVAFIEHSLNCGCPTGIIIVTDGETQAPVLDFPAAWVRQFDVNDIDESVLVLFTIEKYA